MLEYERVLNLVPVKNTVVLMREAVKKNMEIFGIFASAIRILSILILIENH